MIATQPLRLLTAVALVAFGSTLGAQPQQPGRPVSLNFENARLTDVVRSVAASLGLNVVFTDVPEFRLESKAGWEIKLDETNGMFLNLGVESRYDSDPGEGFESHDISYFALLGWNF